MKNGQKINVQNQICQNSFVNRLFDFCVSYLIAVKKSIVVKICYHKKERYLCDKMA